jgi:hypothetical protein
MNDPQWDDWTEQLYGENKCSNAQLLAATQELEGQPKLRELEKRQRDVKKAVAAVKQAYEANPNGSREEIKKAAYRNVTGSVILSILAYALLSAVISKAITWLIDRLFSK